jgi:hypothetical protein
MAETQKLVARAAGSGENLEQAKTAAATIVKGFFEELGWRVRVRLERGRCGQRARRESLS